MNTILYSIEKRTTIFINRWGKWISFVAWFVLNAVMLINHEMFRDEAQSWMITKYNSIVEIIEFCWQEGHPWLYNLILYPFAKLGVPYAGIGWISLIIGAIAVFVFLRKSPFSLSTSIFWIFSPPVFYYYPVFARNYVLALFFLVIIATLWRDRHRHPILLGAMIGFLASSHVLAWIPAVVLALLQNIDAVYNKNFHKRNIAALFVGLLIAAVFNVPLLPQFYNTLDRLALPSILLPIVFLLITFCTVFFVYIFRCTKIQKWLGENNRYSKLYSSATAFVVIITLVVAVIIGKITTTALITASKLLFCVPCLLAFNWISKTMKNEHIQDAVQQERKSRRGETASKIVILSCIYLCCSYLFLYEMQTPYSACKETAMYIEENIPSNAYITTTQVPCTVGITAYMKAPRIQDLIYDEVITYTKWFDKWMCTPPKEEWMERLESTIKEHEEIYLILCRGEDSQGVTATIINQYIITEKAQIVFRSSEKVTDAIETFWILRIKREDIV